MILALIHGSHEFILDTCHREKNWRKKFQNTEDYRKTRDALKQKLDERAAKRLQLQRDINELERVERVQELNNEINDDLDDIFSQIEIERQKGFQEYIERLSPDNSINGSEEEYHSNTTPEPSRTPTQFNVNASEFKVRSENILYLWWRIWFLQSSSWQDSVGKNNYHTFKLSCPT